LLFFVTNDKRGRAVVAALQEKCEEDPTEEDAFIIWTRCRKNLEKEEKK
jgi:hypothetical protein